MAKISAVFSALYTQHEQRFLCSFIWLESDVQEDTARTGKCCISRINTCVLCKLRGKWTLLSSIKKIIANCCPDSVVKKSVTVVYKYRAMRYKADMLFHPNKMLFSCPCCGTKLRSFVRGTYLEYPTRFNPDRYDHTRQDVLCPVCRSLPRHRILALWCEQHLVQLRSSRILYFAPERSMTRWMKRNGVVYITADLFNEADLKLDIQDTGLSDSMQI